MMKKQNKKNIWREENTDKTTTTERIDNTLPMNPTTSTLMKTQITHGKHTEDDNINNIKPKTKPHTKTLNQNKITGNNNTQ